MEDDARNAPSRPRDHPPNPTRDQLTEISRKSQMNTPQTATSKWRAKWIWCDGEDRPKNFYLYVRKVFTVESEVASASICLTADSRYHLFVNGTRVARGPARCDRRWQYYDEWDIKPHLQMGRNVIAALVYHYGEWTFSYMLGRGGFLAEADIECVNGRMIHLQTDKSWRALPAEAWERNLPRMSIQLGFPEIYDARKEVEGWNQPAFDDSHWPAATILGSPGMEPWPNLVLRDIPAMMEKPLHAEGVVDTGEVGKPTAGYYVDLLRVIWNPDNAVAYLATYVWSPADGDSEIHAGSQEAIKLWVNNELVVSHLITRGAAPDQEIVPVHLCSGWNIVLAKIVQGRGQWHFYFRIEGNASDALVYSAEKLADLKKANQVKPWRLLAPFDSAEVAKGFETAYPPEREIDFTKTYTGKNGKEISWISAGVTQETMLTSVVMSREARLQLENARIENPQGLIKSKSPTIFYPGAGHGCYAVIDFGKEVTGYPTIEIEEAHGGEVIDLGYSEILQTPQGEVISPASGKIGIVNADRDGVHYADRYICRSGTQAFQTFDKRAFRYLQIDVRNLTHPIKIGPVSILFSTYPVEYKGSFECSDPLLNRIWEVGRWTVQLNMEDAFTDCPWRERGQWWGDARIEALVNYYAFGDLKLMRKGLKQVAQSQNEGLTWGVYPTDWSGGILPTFTLIWICSLSDYYLFSGDIDLVKELFPAVDRALSFFEKKLGGRSLLRDIPYWPFVDWTDVETKGESASINALYHGTLRVAAGLADTVGDTSKASHYRSLAEELQSAMKTHLWDESISAYRDAIIEDKLLSKVSEQANTWAIVFGVPSKNLFSKIIQAVFDSLKDVVRAGSPYFSFYLLSAFVQAGDYSRALTYIRNNWKRMLDWGATTWWEKWEPTWSFCHGWSAAPTYFLPAEILGVKPAKPGWEEILIHPHPVDLQWAKGVVPAPVGNISVEWKSDENFEMTVEIPTMARVAVPLRQNGVLLVNGKRDRWPVGVSRLEDDGGHAFFRVDEKGTYQFSSR
jgi:alpha-L-rhamnosidase